MVRLCGAVVAASIRPSAFGAAPYSCLAPPAAFARAQAAAASCLNKRTCLVLFVP